MFCLAVGGAIFSLEVYSVDLELAENFSESFHPVTVCIMYMKWVLVCGGLH